MSDRADARTQVCRILDCRGWNENGTRTTPTHGWLRYRPFSLEDLPPAVRDVGNDGLCFRFLVSREVIRFLPVVLPTALIRGRLSLHLLF